jgi:hypothetical protein
LPTFCKRWRCPPKAGEALLQLVLRWSAAHWYKGATAVPARISAQ